MPGSVPLPDLFLTRMKALLGEDYPDFEAAYAQTPAAGLRVNTLKLSAEGYAHLSPYNLEKLPYGDASFQIQGLSEVQPSATDEAGVPAPGRHPHHAAGLYYLQEPSAIAVSELAAPEPGEIVLDLAAAPGGKATAFASALNPESRKQKSFAGSGFLLANEVHPRRVWELVTNLERWGVRNAAVAQEKPENLSRQFGTVFDRVVVDAPCSGEGMFRKQPASRKEWSASLVQSCALRQAAILEDASQLVQPGGVLVYSTCTFSPEENEGVAADFLASHPEFTVESPPEIPGAQPGRPDWIPAANQLPRRAELEKAVRLWPHSSNFEGHFAILLRNQKPHQEDTHAGTFRYYTPESLPFDAWSLFKRFLQESLQPHWLGWFQQLRHRLVLSGSNPTNRALYLVPDCAPFGVPDPGSLNLVRPGWWLGMIRKDRFEPSHSLALGLSKDDAQMSVDFTAMSPDISAYLRGEVLHLPGPDGWMLVCVDGYPLGWGKRSGGVIKNFYPRGLRWT